MIIKNKRELGTNEIRKLALEIIEAGISRVLPSNCIKFALIYNPTDRILTVNGNSYDCSKGRIFVIGVVKQQVLWQKH